MQFNFVDFVVALACSKTNFIDYLLISVRWLIPIEGEPYHDSKLFTHSLNDNKAKSRVIINNNFGFRRCNLFTYPNFCKLFESLLLSITSTNGNRPKTCFSNTI